LSGLSWGQSDTWVGGVAGHPTDPGPAVETSCCRAAPTARRPVRQVGAVQPPVDPGGVRLRRDRGALLQGDQPLLGVVDRGQHLGPRHLAAPHRPQVRAVRLGHRQGDPAGGEQLDALTPSRSVCMAYSVS
jgi:hypothetical protein